MKPLRVSVSVDDGHPLDLKVAALLARHGLRATFYLPIVNREGPPVLNAAQTRWLAKAFEIGSHTLSHRFLAALGTAAATREICDGKKALEDRLGTAIDGFCYPGGHYRRSQIALLRAAGFRFARTTQNLRLDAGVCPYELPTSAQFYPHPRSVWLRNFVSQRSWHARAPALIAALREDDWLVRLSRLLALAQQRGGVFHLWLHALDIERLQLWGPLNQFLAQLARFTAPEQRVANGALISALPAAALSIPSENSAI